MEAFLTERRSPVSEMGNTESRRSAPPLRRDDEISSLDLDEYQVPQNEPTATQTTSQSSSQTLPQEQQQQQHIIPPYSLHTQSQTPCVLGELCRRREFPAHPLHPSAGAPFNHDKGYRRELAGAWVDFDSYAGVKVSLPSDLSAICIGGLPDCYQDPVTEVMGVLRMLNIHNYSDVRVVQRPSSAKLPWLEPNVIVTFAGPDVAEEARRRLLETVFYDEQGRSYTVTIQKAQVRGPSESVHTAPTMSGSFLSEVSYNQVHCTWQRPTRTAILTFLNRLKALSVLRGFQHGDYKVRGGGRDQRRTPSLRLRLDVDVGGVFTVRMTDVGPYATAEDVLSDVPAFLRPWITNIATDQRPLYDHKMVMGRVLENLRTLGGDTLEHCEIFESPNETSVLVRATFSDSFSAGKAATQGAWRSLNNQVDLNLTTHPIHVELVNTVRFRVPSRIYRVLSRDIYQAQTAWFDSGPVKFAVSWPEPDGTDLSYTLTLWGPDRSRLAFCRDKLESVLRGEPLAIEPQILRMDLFTMCESCTADVLRGIEGSWSVAFVLDEKTSRIWIYEPSHGVRGAACQLIKLIADRVEAEMMNPAYAAAPEDQENLDEQVVSQLPTPECLICSEELENPVFMACNHTFCRNCFKTVCLAAARKGRPIQCPGHGPACDSVLQLGWIYDALPPATFETLLETYFRSHVRHHPDLFRYCPTEGCDCIYRVAPQPQPQPQAEENEGLFVCPRCWQRLCTTCHAAHTGLTCPEWREAVYEWQQLDLGVTRARRDEGRRARTRRLRATRDGIMLPLLPGGI